MLVRSQGLIICIPTKAIIGQLAMMSSEQYRPFFLFIHNADILKAYMKLHLKGFTIDAYVRGDKNAEKCALILPGFLDTKDYAHMRSHVDSLAEQGFYALGIDFPGTWQSSGDIADYTITNCLNVVQEIVSMLGRPTLLVGHSNGGRLALQIASENSLITGVIAIMSPLHVLRSNNQTERMQQWKASGERLIKMDVPNKPEQFQEFTVPYSFLLNSEKYPVTEYISSIKQPKLFIAGKRDQVITPAEVEEAFRLAIDPKKYELIDADHNYRKDLKAVTKVNHLIIDFAKKLL